MNSKFLRYIAISAATTMPLAGISLIGVQRVSASGDPTYVLDNGAGSTLSLDGEVAYAIDFSDATLNGTANISPNDGSLASDDTSTSLTGSENSAINDPDGDNITTTGAEGTLTFTGGSSGINITFPDPTYTSDTITMTFSDGSTIPFVWDGYDYEYTNVSADGGTPFALYGPSEYNPWGEPQNYSLSGGTTAGQDAVYQLLQQNGADTGPATVTGTFNIQQS